MNRPVFVVFGESTCNTTDSKYTYANALTLDIMDKLGNDKRFIDCTQADVLNLSLVILYGLIAPQDHDKVSKAKLHEFIEDFNEFKDFSMYTMNMCRQKNMACNEFIDDLIKKETAQ